MKNNIKNIFGGIIAGIIFFLISFAVLWFNEGSNAKSITIANFMQKNAVQIDPNNINPENNGKLVAVYGEAKTSATLKDENVIKPNTLVLDRTVEMYQWEEEEKESDGNRSYNYTKTWSDRRIDSDSFHDQIHHNPQFPISSKTFYASSAKLGSFNLFADQIRKINPTEEIDNLPYNKNYSIQDGKYFSGADITSPSIGDILISYRYAPSGTNVSIIGEQESARIKPMAHKNLEIYVQYTGSLNKNVMIERYRKNNFVKTMLLRFLGWLLMFLGLKLLISPLENLVNKIPILGEILTGASSLILALISLMLSIITIAIAWLAYRPILSILLIIVAAIITILIKQKISIIKEEPKTE